MVHRLKRVERPNFEKLNVQRVEINPINQKLSGSEE
jgi:hypothetical protein